MKRKKPTGRADLRDVLTRPEIFIVIAAVYLISATIASQDPALAVNGIGISVSPLSFLVFSLGLAGFYIGIRTSRLALKMNYLPLVAAAFTGIFVLHYMTGLNLLISTALSLSVLAAAYLLLFAKFKWEWAFAAGMVLLWLNFAFNGLPVMDITIHSDLMRIVNPIFISGFFLSTYSLARMHPNHRFMWLFLIITLSLSTFRLYVGIAFFTWILLEVKNREKRGMEIAKTAALVSCGAFVLVSFMFIGHLLMTTDYSTWQLDPTQTVSYRLAFTMGVFDDIVQLAFPYGYTFGHTITMESTEYVCRLLYGYDERITSTTFGEAMLNFGVLGVILTGWFAGAVLTNVHRKDYVLYALLMATMIATLDVGINIFVMLEFIYLGWLRTADEWK